MPTAGPFTCSLILHFWPLGKVPATAATQDATLATEAFGTGPSASPLNLGSCLLFPARASGCLLLGSARPLGSTVRLRGPAQVRQTGLRTSVLPWRTGSRKRRYGTILCHLPTHYCPQPQISSLSFCLPPESPRLSLSATSHPPIRPFSSCLPQRCSYAASVPNPQTDTKAWPSPKVAVICRLFLTFSFCLLFPSVARVGEKEVGAPGREQSPHGLLAGCCARVKKAGPCCIQTGERSRSAPPPPTSAVHPDLVPRSLTGINGHTSCPSPCLHLQAPERWRHLQIEGWVAKQAPPKRLALTLGIGT